jgi:hypothetical protein
LRTLRCDLGRLDALGTGTQGSSVAQRIEPCFPCWMNWVHSTFLNIVLSNMRVRIRNCCGKGIAEGNITRSRCNAVLDVKPQAAILLLSNVNFYPMN